MRQYRHIAYRRRHPRLEALPQAEAEVSTTVDIHAQLDLCDVIERHRLTMEAARRSKATLHVYRHALDAFLAFLRTRAGQDATWRPPLAALTVENAREWQLHLMARNLSPVTIHLYVAVLKVLSTFLEDEGIVEDAPLRKLRRPSKSATIVVPFTDDQLAAMLHVAATGRNPTRDVAMFFFLLDSGVRAGELCGLRTADVDLAAGVARVFGKGSKERYVQFGTSTAKLIARYYAERKGAGEPWVFANEVDGQMSPPALYKIVSKWAKGAGIRDVRASPHIFRHTFACRFLSAHPGALFHLQTLLGHATLTMSHHYAKITEAKERLPGLSIADGIGLDKTLLRIPPPQRR
jgi:site-specific recombinase XerD